MRRELLQLGMSQLSAGSRTDVGAYHRWGGRAAPLWLLAEWVICVVRTGGGFAGVLAGLSVLGFPAFSGVDSLPAPCRAAGSPGHLQGSRVCMPRWPPASQNRHPPPPAPPPPPPRDQSEVTEANLGDLSGQFTLADHRPVHEIVLELMKEGYVPSWCTACYRKGGWVRAEGWAFVMPVPRSQSS